MNCVVVGITSVYNMKNCNECLWSNVECFSLLLTFCTHFIEPSHVGQYTCMCKALIELSIKYCAFQMALIFNEDGLRNVTPPCVVQQFVNHDALLFKVWHLKIHVFFLRGWMYVNVVENQTLQIQCAFLFTHIFYYTLITGICSRK